MLHLPFCICAGSRYLLLPIEERGRVLSAGYQAVLYDPVGVRPGDLVQVEGIGWLEVETVQRFLHYRLLTANATERRAPGGNEH